MAVSSVSTVSLAAWAYPAANVTLPRVEQTAKSRVFEEDTASSDDPNATSTSEEHNSDAAGPKRADGTPMAPEEIQYLDQLKQSDREVRQHEMAHQIAGGAYTGGASYEYEVGPDGKRYAVAGEVSIDYGPVPNDPQATIEKMQTVIAAAMAPADPSPKDYQVAAQARQYLLEAKLEASMQRSEMEQARSNGAAATSSADESAANEQPSEEQAA
ncbi:putative metalloprotease CJM1_0395 family protein [Halomonas sp. QHL1]|uniref:putative metalloprotease CJM1_0395 family protein n=1 Tax=Halomonas sp. QHL1 TaxID=1123773 RepID=UPI0008FD4E6E|nr:putative metalloprotease CJM1_0395 family protein [Halomonas sp. QHL1]OJA06452.1 SprA-related family protein [Halomonas sp. QHL1]